MEEGEKEEVQEQEQEQAESKPPVEEVAKPEEAKPESRLNRFLLRSMRWLIGILIVAGLGALLVIFTMYVPLQQRLSQSQGDLDQASSRVTELENEVERLSTFEAKNKALQAENNALQAEMDLAELHVAVLSAACRRRRGSAGTGAGRCCEGAPGARQDR